MIQYILMFCGLINVKILKYFRSFIQFYILYWTHEYGVINVPNLTTVLWVELFKLLSYRQIWVSTSLERPLLKELDINFFI